MRDVYVNVCGGVGCVVEVRGAVNGVVFPFSSFLVFFLRQKSGFLLLVVFGALDICLDAQGKLFWSRRHLPRKRRIILFYQMLINEAKP